MSRRRYHSPLREQQARLTRAQILDALIELVGEQGGDVPVRDLAARAGVSERTVYRYFPDRSALLDGLGDHVAERAGWASWTMSEVPTLDALVELIPESFANFDAFEAETRAIAVLNVDSIRPAGVTVRHRTELHAIVERELPDLDADERAELAAVLHLMASSRTWLRFRDEAGLSSDQAARAATRAARAVLASVRTSAGRSAGALADTSVASPSCRGAATSDAQGRTS